MEQQIQQKQPVTTQPAQQPVEQKGEVTEPVEKKSKWYIWLIITLVIIGAGIGVYFWFFAT